ncbi:hypothetical protein EDB92DRAFT_1288316 [Lactarius akahatsu]|uniref:F-box domain-containing protein n=1 Tax=Lactarius akahatsu TaxID=416441 RepID=A0AAD4LE31_9AGAM|nr:hypothetical protein EDB92DRAFT_1288316 [Lactarius akahatsu]
MVVRSECSPLRCCGAGSESFSFLSSDHKVRRYSEDSATPQLLREARGSYTCYSRHQRDKWWLRYAILYQHSGSPPVSLRPSSMSTNSSGTITGLPTELLIRIFAQLPLEDLLSVQHTCRRFRDVVSGSATLQYFLRTKINLLEDQAPDLSLHERVAFLKHHETAWNNLQLNEFTRFSTEVSKARYILQDGYLIYNAVTNPSRYGYIDLYSSPARPNAEAPWTHISLEALRPLSDIVFAVDLNLVVAISKSGQDGLPEASFLEFTTGAPHPLSLLYTTWG